MEHHLLLAEEHKHAHAAWRLSAVVYRGKFSAGRIKQKALCARHLPLTLSSACSSGAQPAFTSFSPYKSTRIVSPIAAEEKRALKCGLITTGPDCVIGLN